MKRLILSFVTLLLALQMYGQDGIVLPGKGHINVENLNKIDYNMDISQLSLSELRVLRNALAARQGYLFMTSDLRSVFASTSWYIEKAYERYAGNLPEIRYNAEETAFINRLKAREAELSRNNYAPAGGGLVNAENIVNPYLLTDFAPELKAALTRNGFGIVASNDEQLFQIYEKNMYGVMPSFITTDLYLQLFHMYFDSTLRKIEASTLLGAMTKYCSHMYKLMDKYSKSADNAELRNAAEWNKAYFAVAQSLFTGEKPQKVAAEYTQAVRDELENVYNESDNFSEYLGYTDVKFAYSLFRPRGHYTRNEAVKRYFRGMMWLQTVPFGSDSDTQLLCAAVIAEVMHGDSKAQQLYDRIDKPIRFLMGEPDNVTIMQLYDIMAANNADALKIQKSDKILKKVRKAVDELGETQIRIRPVFERTSRVKINVMPQRYTPDAEVLLKTVDYYSPQTKRDVPMGLDFMATIGVDPAKNILFDELKEQERWDGLTGKLTEMTTRMGEIDWNATVYNRWEQALKELCVAKDSRYPYFMNTTQWDKKNLNAALASWAELKHDAILYAKQPFAAECGDADLPDPITKSYVEPNIAFWTKAIEVLDELTRVLDSYELLTQETREQAQKVRDEAEFLLQISNKELKHETITDEEYNRMFLIGGAYEHITLDLVLEATDYKHGWYQVTGADKSISVVADVFTSNGDNNPDKSILYEAVGPADEIYVVVEIDGLLYLTRGAVFSYREFKRPLGQPRLTDEEWQEMLPKAPAYGRPSWMEEIIVPLKKAPEVNSEVFYSGGC